MAKISPFKGVRPRKELVARVAAPPYDVLSSDEARQLAAGNDISFLHISKAEIDLEPGVNLYSPAVYKKAADNFRRFVMEKLLLHDPRPCLYVYRQVMPQGGGRSHSQVGIVAGASVEEYQRNLIRKHELTRKDKEDDRTRHVDILDAQTGPVFLTYAARPGIDEMVGKIVRTPVEYDFTSSDEIRHTFWVVSEETVIKALQREFEKLEIMYIADGHHRAAAAARVREMRREVNMEHKGEEDYNYFLAVIFPHNQMQIMAYNRVVKDLNGLTFEEFLNRVAAKFTGEDWGNVPYTPEGKHTFGMYIQGNWFKLVPVAGSYIEGDAVGSLDVSILQDNLLAPILGIKDPRTDRRIDFVGGIRGIPELSKLVDSGKFKVAFALHPTSIEDLIRVAEDKKIMPPKSTWFEPKLRDGLVSHLLD